MASSITLCITRASSGRLVGASSLNEGVWRPRDWRVSSSFATVSLIVDASRTMRVADSDGVILGSGYTSDERDGNVKGLLRG